METRLNGVHALPADLEIEAIWILNVKAILGVGLRIKATLQFSGSRAMRKLGLAAGAAARISAL